ncbi:MAG: hypothetical protein E7480_00230 [Ruminococcaceae bacterium]|nr:hypothetical protein [Oscillospiraceae bacterium]
MDCKSFKELIMPYIDGENIDRQAFEEHMQACEECRAEYELVKSIFEASSSIGQDLNEDFSRNVMREIRKEKMRKKTVLKRIFAGVGTVAAIFVICFIGSNDFFKFGGIKNNMDSEMKDEAPQASSSNSNSYYVTDEETEKKAEDTSSNQSTAIVGDSDNSASSNEQFSLLPFSIKNIYRIDDNDTFKYVIKIDYETGKKLIGHKDIAFLCDNDIPLLMSELSIEEIEALCNSNGIKVLEKCTDYSYGGLRKNASYGIVYLYKEVN